MNPCISEGDARMITINETMYETILQLDFLEMKGHINISQNEVMFYNAT